MTFHCIISKRNTQTRKLLEAACGQRHIEFIAHDPNTFDFTKTKPLGLGDLLYRADAPRQSSTAAKTVEKYLLNERVASFYHVHEQSPLVYNASTIVHQYLIFQKKQLSLPQTVPYVNGDRQLLTKYVDHLGGFPVVLKTAHGSHGIGTIIVESLPSLFSVIDFMIEARQSVTMQQYINVATSARLIVIGDRVVDSIEYQAPDNDFRSNAGSVPNVRVKKFSSAVEELATNATNALSLEAGGVDILINAKGQAFLTEVNFPFNFARAQNITHVDTAGMMVDFLVNKSKALAA